MRDLGVFLEYRGFKGSVNWSAEDNCYFGKIMDISSVISYEGDNYADLWFGFREAVQFQHHRRTKTQS